MLLLVIVCEGLNEEIPIPTKADDMVELELVDWVVKLLIVFPEIKEKLADPLETMIPLEATVVPTLFENKLRMVLFWMVISEVVVETIPTTAAFAFEVRLLVFTEPMVLLLTTFIPPAIFKPVTPPLLFTMF
jgi:hypothetical protein